MQQEINDVNEAIQESTSNIIEFGNSIRDIKWDIFDKIQDMISGITDESDFLIDLMSSKDLFEDNGSITDRGKATMGLHGVNLNTYMSQADEYRKEMDKINAEIAKDPYNQDLIERRKELLELQQESILAAEDEKDAIMDLVKDGINKQLDSLDDLINKYTDMLDNQKDMYDYQQEIAEKQKEINTLEKQLTAYKGDNSEEGAANRQQLQNELNELKVDLEETQYEKSIAEQRKLLDELYLEYETVLNMRMDNIDVLIADVINNVNSESLAIRDTIISEADSVGYQITDSMSTIWETNSNNIVNTITTYGNNFTSILTGVQTAINDIKLLIQKAVEASNAKAASNINSSSSGGKGITSTSSSAKPKTTTNTTNINRGDGVPRVGDRVTFASGRYYYSSDGLSPTGNQRLGQSVYITKINTASWATKPYHISTGGSLGNGDLGWVTLNQLKGYRFGSRHINKRQWARVNEDGDELVLSDGAVTMADGTVLRKVNPGDKIFNNAMSEKLWSLAQNADSLLNPMNNFVKSGIGNMGLPEFTPVSNASNIQNDIDVTIEIEKVQDYNDFVRQFQQDNKVEKMVQEIGWGQALRHGKLRKYQIKI